MTRWRYRRRIAQCSARDDRRGVEAAIRRKIKRLLHRHNYSRPRPTPPAGSGDVRDINRYAPVLLDMRGALSLLARVEGRLSSSGSKQSLRDGFVHDVPGYLPPSVAASIVACNPSLALL